MDKIRRLIEVYAQLRYLEWAELHDKFSPNSDDYGRATEALEGIIKDCAKDLLVNDEAEVKMILQDFTAAVKIRDGNFPCVGS